MGNSRIETEEASDARRSQKDVQMQLFGSKRPLHVQGVANRDVKLENTLLVSSARPLIKLCDFGYSKVQAWVFHGGPPSLQSAAQCTSPMCKAVSGLHMHLSFSLQNC